MKSDFRRKTVPFRRPDSNTDSLMAAWPSAFRKVCGMPSDQVERLEQGLLRLRRGMGVTVPQMTVLRAIAARRVAEAFDDGHRKAQA